MVTATATATGASTGKTSGVGYSPGPGLCFWVWSGGSPAGTTQFNPAAGDPFSSGQLDLAVFNARYGGRPVRADGAIANFVVDAETLLGGLTRAMELAAAQGIEPEFRGTPSTHTMIPTLRESHDYAAVHPDGGRRLMARLGIGAPSGSVNPPGQPAIVKLFSNIPGEFTISMKTGRADAFEVQVGRDFRVVVPDQPDSFPVRTYRIPLAAGMETGLHDVQARSFRDGVPGKWSRKKIIYVETLPAVDPGPQPLTIADIPEQLRHDLNLVATLALRLVGSAPGVDVRDQAAEFVRLSFSATGAVEGLLSRRKEDAR